MPSRVMCQHSQSSSLTLSMPPKLAIAWLAAAALVMMLAAILIVPKLPKPVSNSGTILRMGSALAGRVFQLTTTRGGVPASKSTEQHCEVDLPMLAAAPHTALVQRAEHLLEDGGSTFPFVTEAGYNISLAEARAVDQTVKNRMAPGDKMPLCQPSTYDGHSISRLAEVFMPGAVGQLSPADALVDLGAGIGKVLAVVALTTNASARGIELSSERYVVGCGVLRLLAKTFARGTGIGVQTGRVRRFELWQGDLLKPPAELLRAPSRVDGALTFFTYANCLSYGLLEQVMRLVSQNMHPCVRLLTTKAPNTLSQVHEGLRRSRKQGGFYSLFTRDGDLCRDTASSNETRGSICGGGAFSSSSQQLAQVANTVSQTFVW